LLLGIYGKGLLFDFYTDNCRLSSSGILDFLFNGLKISELSSNLLIYLKTKGDIYSDMKVDPSSLGCVIVMLGIDFLLGLSKQLI